MQFAFHYILPYALFLLLFFAEAKNYFVLRVMSVVMAFQFFGSNLYSQSTIEKRLVEKGEKVKVLLARKDGVYDDN